jgi:hypothetical protein
VTVFDTKHHSRLLFYCIGYGLPLLITGITVTISLVGGEKLYLRRNGGWGVEACWLDVEAMPAIVAPAGMFFMSFSLLIVSILRFCFAWELVRHCHRPLHCSSSRD